MPTRSVPAGVLSAALAVVLLVAACGGSTPSSSEPSGTGAPATAEPGTTPEPGATDAPAPTDEPATSDPGTSEEPQPTEDPAASPTEEPGTSASPEPSGTTGSAGACTGSDKNRDFYAGFARVAEWPVLCPVLPKGWFVSAGSYRLANGGKLEIAYKGPSGATIALSEGAFCADAGGCVPTGTDIGETAFGSMTGTLVGLDDGGYAVVVDRGLNPSWLLVVSGLDQETATAIAAALAEVAE